MMDKIAMLWAYSPKETAGMIAITILCSAAMAVLIGLMMWPQDPEKMLEDNAQ